MYYIKTVAYMSMCATVYVIAMSIYYNSYCAKIQTTF